MCVALGRDHPIDRESVWINNVDERASCSKVKSNLSIARSKHGKCRDIVGRATWYGGGEGQLLAGVSR